jgi:chromosome segregation ATPase
LVSIGFKVLPDVFPFLDLISVTNPLINMKSAFVYSIKSSSGAKDAPNALFMNESDVQAQLKKLQEELTREKQEKMRALDEVEDLKKNKSRTKKLKSNGSDYQLDLADRLQQLEGELDAARDSERKLLVSLEAQTKQLEQTKVSLEEANLEITSLQDSKKSLEAVTVLSSNPSREPAKNFRRRYDVLLFCKSRRGRDMVTTA